MSATAHRRYAKPRLTVGANDNSHSAIQGAAPARSVFVYRVRKDFSVDDMRSFLEPQVDVIDLRVVSRDDARNKSFKLTVPWTQLDTLFDPNF